MTDTSKGIGIAFPSEKWARDALKLLIPHMPMPAPVPDSEERVCPDCGVKLIVGPKLLAVGCTVYCPIDGITRMREAEKAGHTPEIVSLGNPNSRYEH